VIWPGLAAPWQAAIEEAWDSYRARTNPIGAVICDPAGRILARGRNRILDPAACAGQLNGTRLAHAEVNALLQLRDPDLDPRDLVLYTTVEPCPLCVGAVVTARLREIRYASRDPWAGSMSLLEQNAYLASKQVRREGPADRLLEEALKVLAVEAGLRRGEGTRGAAVRESYRALLPDAVAAGELLFASGELHELAASGGTAPQALALLESRVTLRRPDPSSLDAGHPTAQATTAPEPL